MEVVQVWKKKVERRARARGPAPYQLSKAHARRSPTSTIVYTAVSSTSLSSKAARTSRSIARASSSNVSPSKTTRSAGNSLGVICRTRSSAQPLATAACEKASAALFSSVGICYARTRSAKWFSTRTSHARARLIAGLCGLRDSKTSTELLLSQRNTNCPFGGLTNERATTTNSNT